MNEKNNNQSPSRLQNPGRLLQKTSFNSSSSLLISMRIALKTTCCGCLCFSLHRTTSSISSAIVGSVVIGDSALLSTIAWLSVEQTAPRHIQIKPWPAPALQPLANHCSANARITIHPHSMAHRAKKTKTSSDYQVAVKTHPGPPKIPSTFPAKPSLSTIFPIPKNNYVSA